MLLDVLRFPDRCLRIKAKPVPLVNDSVRTLVADMFETMYYESGIGLAATQVNHHIQVMVMDVPEVRADYDALVESRNKSKNEHKARESKNPICFINAKIIAHSDTLTDSSEGCLSVPNFQATIKRYSSVHIEALDETNAPFNLKAEGLLAICIQHELDHLRGKLFIDYLSKLKRKRLAQKLAKVSV